MVGQRSIPHSAPCHDYARSVREPFSVEYQPRANLDELNGEARLAFWGWEGNISRQLFDATAANPRLAHYKILNRQVYVEANHTEAPAAAPRRTAVEEIMKLAVHLYPIPDMEYLTTYGDEQYPERPVLAMCVRRNSPKPGFTLPTTYPWHAALGPTQIAAYHGCLWDRYPPNDRLPLIGWRGSTTGSAAPVNMETCLKLLRVRMHLLTRQHPDLFDARINNVVQSCDTLLRPLLNDTGSRVNPEDFNRYCAVLDMDGNSWSDRFLGIQVHQPTPILKQATNVTSFAEHFFAPGVQMETFDPSLDGIVDQARRIIEDCKRGEASQGQAMARRAQAAAKELLSHVGIIRSMAYTLVNYRRLSAFEPDRSLEGFARLNATCCAHSTLPPELLAAMAAKDQAPS